MRTRSINPTYIKERNDGSYEFGVVIINIADRRKDVLMPQGERETYDDAVIAASGCAGRAA